MMKEQMRKKGRSENCRVQTPLNSQKKLPLTPLTKEQLVDILKPALIKHYDVLDGVRNFFDKMSPNLFVTALA